VKPINDANLTTKLAYIDASLSRNEITKEFADELKAQAAKATEARKAESEVS
jgi:hypothetical protein